ncbi:MAG: hypothetical protein JWM16_5257 [Verrucomicrobiales bacterium]|nr:hypothetical protein [Verrucomicrobiales bacterium]
MSLHFYQEKTTFPRLPHPQIPLAVFLIVEQGVCTAWELMQKQPRGRFNLGKATEDEITHELYERLFDEVFNSGMVAGFDNELLSVMTRESKIRNFNGESLDKMPDLLFRIIGRAPVEYPSQDWLYVECKPVDKQHSAGAHYCDKGLRRFVRGDYAWTMTSAMMVAYARPGYTIIPKVEEALEERKNDIPTFGAPQPCKRSVKGQFHDQVQVTEHLRLFSYSETSSQAPNIIIRHLWLRRN